MGADQNFEWHRAIASALDWWRDAGVDALVEEAPRDWLAAPTAAPVAPAPAALAAAALPDTLDAFLAWRGGGEAPEAGWAGAMLAAEGPVDARVMVLVDCPERDDASGGRLLGGAAGRLFDRMLAAIGLSREAVHLASVCLARPAGGRVARDDEARLGELARHHAALVAPKRLLVLGNAASRAILGADVAQVRGSLGALNHRNGSVGVVASHPPRLLLERPALKAEAWRDLRTLIGGMS